MNFCPQCKAYVWCERTAYPDVVYYTCKRHKHHFKHELKNGEIISGDKPITPPKGYDDKE